MPSILACLIALVFPQGVFLAGLPALASVVWFILVHVTIGQMPGYSMAF